MSLGALFLSAALAAAPAARGAPGSSTADTPELVRVECEGPVRYGVSADGKTRLIMSGGVKVKRGETVLSARAAEAVIARGGRSPELVRVEGGVVLRSPVFTVRADVAEMRTVPPAPVVKADVKADAKADGQKDATRDSVNDALPTYEVKLERRDLAEVEFRAGDVRVACRGPLTYSSLLHEARFTGGVRAESPKLRARCKEATVVLRERTPVPRQEEKGEGKSEKTPAVPAVKSIELRGDVVLDTPEKEGAPARRVRAARAFYSVAEDTISFTGTPAPRVEYGGVTLTAPEIVLHLSENRIVPRGGKMRAVLGPVK